MMEGVPYAGTTVFCPADGHSALLRTVTAIEMAIVWEEEICSLISSKMGNVQTFGSDIPIFPVWKSELLLWILRYFGSELY